MFRIPYSRLISEDEIVSRYVDKSNPNLVSVGFSFGLSKVASSGVFLIKPYRAMDRGTFKITSRRSSPIRISGIKLSNLTWIEYENSVRWTKHS